MVYENHPNDLNKSLEVAVKKESRSGALTWLIVLGVIALLVALIGL